MATEPTLKWIVPPKSWDWPDFVELWQYRSLMKQLAIKDFKVRYVQTWLGGLWVLINPVVSALLLYFVFSRVTPSHHYRIDVFVFVMSGMVCWTFFSSLIPEAMQGMMSAQSMIKKIYFPKLVLPVSKMAAALVETGVTFILFLAICLWRGQLPDADTVWMLPLFFVAMVFLGLALAVWACILVLVSKDFLHVIPHMIRLGMFVCPIAYPSELVPAKWQWLYFLNPVSGIMEWFRSMLFQSYDLNPWVWISGLVAMLLLVSGLVVFRKYEHTLADIL